MSNIKIVPENIRQYTSSLNNTLQELENCNLSLNLSRTSMTGASVASDVYTKCASVCKELSASVKSSTAKFDEFASTMETLDLSLASGIGSMGSEVEL